MLKESLIRVTADALARIAEIDKALETFEALKREREALLEYCERTRLMLEQFSLGRSPGERLHLNGNPERVTLQELGSLQPSDSTNRLDEGGLWKAIQMVMGITGAPMTAGEILSALERERIEVPGVHKRESVRTAIFRKPEVFERVGRGRFALQIWPEFVKRSSYSPDQEDAEAEDLEQPVLPSV